MACLNIRGKSTENGAQTEQGAQNQLHATANAQGKGLHRSGVNWFKVKPACWSPGSKIHITKSHCLSSLRNCLGYSFLYQWEIWK